MKPATSENGKKRRNFIYWAAAVASGLMFWKVSKITAKEEEKVRMLTEDGQLVEIDVKHLAGGGHKLSNKELQNWVKRKKNN